MTVGELVGDGAVLKFSETRNLQSFDVCLRISINISDSNSNTFNDVADFGFSTHDYNFIYPLGLENIEINKEKEALFWCASVSYDEIAVGGDEVVHLFPIYRDVNYEYMIVDYVSYDTMCMMYTLGACYCLDFVLLFLLFGRMIYERGIDNFPFIGWIVVLFIILCVFRIVFFFGYPNGTFDDQPLADFVVFEIPTFFLFTAVILCTANWRKLSQDKYEKKSKYFLFQS